MASSITLSQETVEDLRLPSTLRLELEQRLDHGVGKRSRVGFEQRFKKDLKAYAQILEHTLNSVFARPDIRSWFQENNIEVLTWHYKTRHPAENYEDETVWLSGQIVFVSRLKRNSNLSPFPGRKSPYIGIYGNEKAREARGSGGPLSLVLIDGKADVTPAPENSLLVPPSITKIIKRFPPHEGGKGSLSEKHLAQVRKVSAHFIRQLQAWMYKARGQTTKPLDALNYLMASLKVTLRLHSEYHCDLPRSTFLCPAYVADEEVGGMAFACNGVVSRRSSLIGESISATLLAYIRLREDALAHDAAAELERINQAKRFMINRFVHDFRHPVESLQGALKATKRDLTSIESQLSHLNRVLNETVIVFEGRNPDELLKAKKRPDNVGEFFADLRFFFKRRFQEAGKLLEFQPDPIPAEWHFRIDRGMLHEVIENLLANALEHGGSKVKVKLEKLSKGYRIHVQDNGAGIPPKRRDQIFKAFASQGSFKNVGRIRGRGLAIARMLVEAHGGTLKLDDSHNAGGTDFVIELPAA